MSGFADDSLISDFVVESRENLDAIEPDLLAMEQEGAEVSQEIINRVFRAIHSMKGGAGFLAFESLKKLSHTMESVLMRVRDGQMAISPDLMDVLLNGVDKLRAMVDDIQASDDVPIEEDLTRLHAILEEGGVAIDSTIQAQAAPAEGTDEASSPGKTFDLDAESVRAALEHGMRLFAATAYIHQDIQDKGITPLEFLDNIESVGSCLDTQIDMDALPNLEQCIEEDLAFTFLFATVLEEDLVAMALELPEDQIAALDTDAVKEQFIGEPEGAAAQNEAASPAQTELPHMLGQILSERLGVSADAIHTALGKQKQGYKRKIGEILVEQGVISETQIAEALQIQKDLRAEKAAPAPVAAKASSPQVSESLRVRVDLLTRLMNTAGELVLGRNQLLRALEGREDVVAGLAAILQNMDLVTTELQEGIMQTRMQPIGSVFGKFTRVVRDMARDLGKEIDLQVEGSEVELDKSIIELLGDPLTHIIRNCCDHAIETPDERERAGKRRGGRILLRAYHEGGQVNISISDDGRGIDAKRVLQKAIEKGVVQEDKAAKLSERDIVNLVFAPGFSTAEVVTEVSGRGVGMDVVRTNIEKLGGHIEMDTEVGVGTNVLLRLPLTLAIIPSLVVGASGQRFAVPQVNLVELVWVRAVEVKDRIEQVHGAPVLRLRGRLLPLVRLSDVLNMPRAYAEPDSGAAHEDRREGIIDRRSTVVEEEGAGETGAAAEDAEAHAERGASDRRENWRGDYNILVLQVGSNRFGVIVDELFDSEEIVVKPLSALTKDCQCFAGATIMGDGRVIMILDASGLAEEAGLHFSDLEAEEKRRLEEEARKEAAAAAVRRSIILFNGAPDEFFAVPQDKVLRLERIETANIEEVGGREFTQYRGAGLPLVRLDHYLSVNPLPPEASALFLIIPKHVQEDGSREARAGIVVSNIVDAVDVEVSLDDSTLSGPGLKGSAIVQDKLTVFLDPTELTAAAGIEGDA